MLLQILLGKLSNGAKLIRDILKFRYQCLLQKKIECKEKKYVFMFHNITDDKETLESDEYAISPQTVKYMILQLSEADFKIVSPDLILSNENKSVVFSFDDAYKGVYTDLFPFFVNYDFPFVVFQTVDFIDKEHYLSDEMIRNMLQYEGFSLGAHTLTHTQLSTLDREQICQEIMQSKRILQEKYKASVTCLAYPYGDFVSINYMCVKEAIKNYDFAFSTIQTGVKGIYKTGWCRYLIPRININEKNANRIMDCILQPER